MRYRLSEADALFVEEVQCFLKDNLDPHLARKVKYGEPVAKSEQDEWTRTLNRQGWAAPNWPVEYGGTGWNMVRRHLFDQTMRLHHAPQTEGFGFNMVGPAIIKYGSEAQKAFYLPKILNQDINWCQGYSEPGAGSDLASVSTRAVLQGDHYVVNGSKIWTSRAEWADHIFLLVRTDPDAKKQLGITFLLMDMNQLGVEVKPLLAFNGARLWNQVFFENAIVPRENCLGGENKGWSVAKSLLGDERLLVSRVGENLRICQRLLDLLGSPPIGMNDTEDWMLRLSKTRIRLEGLEASALRLLSKFDQGGVVGAEPSMLKLQGSQLVQAFDELLMELIGEYALPENRFRRNESSSVSDDSIDMIASGRYHHRGFTLAGGTSEIQHDIIAKSVLGL